MESASLRDAIRLSITETLSATAAGSLNDDFDEDNPAFRKIVEGLIYSRKFIPTYHLVVLGIICIFAASHWTEKALRWRYRRISRLQTLEADEVYDGDAETIKAPTRIPPDGNEEPEAVYSSSSSTLEECTSPPRKGVDDEETPLLGQVVKPTHPRRTIVSSAQAVLMYQPQPIPIINKIFPSNSTSLLILAFLGLNIFYMFHGINFNTFEVFVLADRFGLIFVANLPLLYLLAAKTQPLRFLTGRSYESLNIFHRRLGELLCLAAFLHTAGMFGVWYTLFRPSGFTLVHFLLIKVILLGMGAFISYELLYITSLASFRQRWYELFLGTHIVLQVVALVLVFFHHPNSRPYVGAALGIFFIDRLVHRLGIKSSTFETQTKILEDEESIKLSTTIALQPRTRLSAIFGSSIQTGWRATDHIFITVPSLSHLHQYQAHPFTIASPAPTPEIQDAKLELIIRAQDGFSRDLLNACRLHKQLQIRLDGPYGSSHARNMLEESDLALIVVGGSGIAVGWPLVHHLLNTSHSDPETPQDFRNRKQKIILIWVIRESSQITWLGRYALADAENKGAEIIIPRATEEIGRPDLQALVKEYVGLFGDGKGKRTRVVVSGPDGMGRSVRNTCAGLRMEGRDVDVAVEKFGW